MSEKFAYHISWGEELGSGRGSSSQTRVHSPRTLVSLLVNPRLCCTEERTRGHHEFMNESQLRECLVHGKRRLRRDLGATSQTGRQAPAGSAPAALGRAPAPAGGWGALPFSPLSQPPPHPHEPAEVLFPPAGNLRWCTQPSPASLSS